ncbi:NAD(P)/FAD-dependent oxidoreductase [Canibacter zhoujuaniae]|uniref:NAD(P)/FAD-dependent oxidoreductase n=1 Tax=Canibacter zhoujuaniae TaxID=2708343 RepID=UPI0014203F5F|nr:NAD(P)/FAD-dependent oxidoreductase [Canibacter zhoujuaniae]
MPTAAICGAGEAVPANCFDAVVIGAGPAGLACALNLVRGHARVLLVDANRPRHSATLISHGFITRDGASPLELRQLGREEFLTYPSASYLMAEVTAVQGGADAGFELSLRTVRGGEVKTVSARIVVVATGLAEQLPEITNLRAYYGTALHSCVVCDGYEKTNKPLVIIPHPEIEREAVLQAETLVRRFSPRVTVLNADSVSEIIGERAQMHGVRLHTGEVVAASAGFVLPKSSLNIKFLAPLGVTETAFKGLGLSDPHAALPGLTRISGLYAVGEAATGKPEQLLVAAGSGAAIVPHLLVTLSEKVN